MPPAPKGRRFHRMLALFLFAIPALAFFSPTAIAATRVVTDRDKGADVEVKVGDTLVLRLSSNPSTGYTWYVHPKTTAVLRLVGQTQADPNDQTSDPVPGRPIVQVFTFLPRRKGDGILLLRYVRAWEKPVLGEEQYTLHVIVNE